MARTQIFNGVAVGLPSKVSGCEAEEEWQEVDWVTWSIGDVSVDTESFLLVFKPLDTTGSVKSKALGNLIGASPTAVAESEDSQLTLVVTTSDALHRLYRFTFSSAQSAGEFAKLAVTAAAAEARKAAQSPHEANAGTASAARLAQLAAAIEEKLEGRWPLVFTGVELYGPAPGSSSAGSAGSAASSSEVLLGRGACVLLDPPEDQSGRVGSYEFLFFEDDEGAREPVKSLQISPGMALKRQQADDEDGPAVTFELRNASVPGLPVFNVAFDAANTGNAFARDFRVRQRVMELSLKTVKHARAVGEARGELEELKRSGCCATMSRLLVLLSMLIMVGISARVGMLYSSQPGTSLDQHLQAVLMEFFNAGRLLQNAALRAASQACEVLEARRPAGAL
mmetsp:Transcript_27069/g.49229  ORF Transcript_27069/g.49229 Transcript_27069/m.49229 type:complete len:396 (+) Transcript_27069:106-1293(+)